jgi:hypothetical protein
MSQTMERSTHTAYIKNKLGFCSYLVWEIVRHEIVLATRHASYLTMVGESLLSELAL